MKTTTFITILLFCSFLLNVQAQDTIPLLKGNVNISITKGTIQCDFVLKNMPMHIANNYVIRINAGMNIHYFKNIKYNNLIYYDIDNKDTLSSGESLAYFFPGNHNKGRFLPPELELNYVGMFPIADSVNGYNVQDWRGNIAFNGYSLRADGYQSAWYPILYDMKKQVIYNKVKYDVNIHCDDCSTLFVNGSKPVKAQSANFVSDVPQEMTMYCGKYETSNVNGTWLLNPDMDVAHQKQFLDVINGFKSYYEKNFGIPYKQDITFIQTTNTASPEHAFLFIAYPTILNIGTGKYGLHAFFDKKEGDYYKPYLAHELGHYYFGEYLTTNSEFGPVIQEGFAEYLSLKAAKRFLADSVYQKIISKKIKTLEKFKPEPLAAIKRKADFSSREFYVYYYVPIVLTAIEKEIGEKEMWNWMKTMLTTKTNFTDYQFFEKTFDDSIEDKNKAQKIKDEYFTSTESLQNAINRIQVKN